MTTKDKFLGEFEQFLLLSILKLGDEAYGTTIRQLLADKIERDVTIGALYTTLDRLEKKGFVASKMGEATSERGGRAKKYFRVSALGEQALKRSKQALQVMWQDVALQAGHSYE
ncbi:MAG: PadR family transcriptional regulator [Psychrobium sp.]